MNPFRWSIEQQIALCLAAVSGGALGEVTGYFIYLSATGVDANSLGDWVIAYGFWWAVVGASIGVATLYLLEKI